MTARPFTTPQTHLNAAEIRAERRAQRLRLGALALAAFACVTGLEILHMALTLAHDLPAVLAQAAATTAIPGAAP